MTPMALGCCSLEDAQGRLAIVAAAQAVQGGGEAVEVHAAGHQAEASQQQGGDNRRRKDVGEQ